MATNKELKIIGRTERIELLDSGVKGVPAKIDTGADASAISISNINESNGLLSFTLFDPTSSYYTGEVVSTREYWFVTIKNSFGQVEKRYKTSLRISIAGKTIKVKFTLADRSQNRYPVLIGKATLKGKFLVDVASQPSIKRSVLVLASRKSDSLKLFSDKLNASLNTDLDYSMRQYDEIGFYIEPSKTSIIDMETKKDLKTFDLVYFRTYAAYAETAGAIAEYLLKNNVQFIDREVAHYHSQTKLTQYIKLAQAGLPVPKTILMSHVWFSKSYSYVSGELGVPFILKDIWSDRGNNNYLISSKKQFLEILSETAGQEKLNFVAQKYVPNTGNDARLLVLDKQVPIIIARTSDGKSHMTNSSKGGKAVLVDAKTFDEAVKTMAIRAADVMERQVAGVDAIQDMGTSEWYLLEVNNSPQISSGSNIDDKIAAFATFVRHQINKVN